MFIMHFLKFFRAPTYEAVGQISVGQIFAFNTSFDLGMHKVVPFGLENLNLKFNWVIKFQKVKILQWRLGKIFFRKIKLS